MDEEQSLKLAQEINSIFVSKMIDVFTTISNTILDIKEEEELSKKEDFNFDELEDYVFVSIETKGFFSGKFYVAMTKEEVARFSDFMMMGDGKAPYEEDFNEAISELFNQIMGAFITDINQRYTTTLELVSCTASLEKLENVEEILVSKLSIDMDGFDKSDFYVIIPNSILTSLVSSVSDQLDETEKKSEEESSTVEVSGGSSAIEQSELEEFFPSGDDNSSSKGLNTQDFGNLNLLLDIDLDISIELGRSEMSIRKLLNIKSGSIVELDKLAGEPVDILVNGKVIANGEIVIIDDSFGIRLNNLVSLQERLLSLR